jgi:hypothetical protein
MCFLDAELMPAVDRVVMPSCARDRGQCYAEDDICALPLQDLLTRRSMPPVRSVRRNPYPQVSVLPVVR